MDPELTRDCGRCSGFGQVAINGQSAKCPQCLDGKVPTFFGEEILEFVNKFLLWHNGYRGQLTLKVADLEDTVRTNLR